MPIRAVLFDVGGPIDMELASERDNDRCIVEALRRHHVSVTPDEYEAANAWAVEAFAPDTYSAIIWRLTGGDRALAERVTSTFQRLAGSRPLTFDVRPGISELLHDLRHRGFLLGLVANQPARALDELNAHGLAEIFHDRQLTGTHGLRKPDPRVFVRTAEALGVGLHECLVVGDRVDNDISPARVLGMATILFRTGRHRNQQPRSAAEVPDAVVHVVEGLRLAIDALVAR